MSEHLGRTLAALVDEQLNHDDRDRALAHLTHCPGCQADVAEQRALKARLASLAAPTMPGSLAQRLASLTVAPPTSSAPVAAKAQKAAQKTKIAQVGDPGQSRSQPERHPTGSGMASNVRPAAVSPPREPRPARRRFGRPARPIKTRQSPPPPSGQPRRHRMRTLVGASAVMLVAVAGSVTLADSRNPAGSIQPITAPTARKIAPPAVPSPLQRFSSVSFLPMSYVQIP